MIPTRSTAVRGITILIAVILSSVVLSVALALLDISYKQILLASSAKQSQYAFYNSDSAMECALYWDQQKDAFDFIATPYLASGVQCSEPNGTSHTIIPTSSVVGFIRTTTLTIPCTTGGNSSVVTIYKSNAGGATLYATGYSSCTVADPRRIERGVTVTYGDVVGGATGSTLSYLVVAGGGSGGTAGGGGTDGGGGGGGGGVIQSGGPVAFASGTYTVTVGSGGAGHANDGSKLSGTNSSIVGGVINSIAIGGGGGGSNSNAGGAVGGSGGGSNGNSVVGNAAGTPGQGNQGGAGTGAAVGGGGGGAGGPGINTDGGSGATNFPSGNGGPGISSSISGSSITYAAGGGAGWGPFGSGRVTTAGDSSGGGQTANAPAHRGGGGGGNAFTATSGSGGSGVVIVSFPTGSISGFSTVGGVLTTSGGNDIYTFNSSGSFTIP